MKQINLSKGKVALVDDQDFEFLNQFKWSACGNEKYGFKAVRGFSYIKDGKATGRLVIMHRILMLSPPKEFEVDHIDGNSLNNQKNNLRICTHAQNMRNRRQKSQSSSKYKGVHKKTGKDWWEVRIQHEGKLMFQKLYKSELEAAKAYNENSLRIHGQFACLNIL